MQLSDVEVRLDRAQFPRLVLQEHPQLFQSGPETTGTTRMREASGAAKLKGSGGIGEELKT